MAKNEKPYNEKLDFHDLPAYKSVGEYLTSKKTTKEALRTFNHGDDIDRNPAISLYLARKQFEKTKEILKIKKKEHEKNINELNRKWDKLAKDQQRLRKDFINVDQFMKENKEKRNRAQTKITEQNRLEEERTGQLKKMEKTYEDMKEMKNLMDKMTKKCQIYEDFLNKVVESEESINSISDLLKQYETLAAARKTLTQSYIEKLEKLEQTHSQMVKLIDNYYTTIGILHLKLTVLNQRYEQAVLKTRKWERTHQEIRGQAMEKVAEIVGIKEACQRMYCEICQRRKIKPVFINDCKKQLVLIKDFFGQIERVKEVVDETKERQEKMSGRAIISGSSGPN